MSNLLAGVAAATLDPCERLDIMVGGLPVERRLPFQYKATDAPADVIEEYTRPSRLVEHGRVVVREALSEPELVDLPHVGTVEAFNTDGLRSLVRTLRVPSMRERTLRWPGHVDLMRGFRAAGFFSTEPVRVGASMIVPREVTAALLFPKWSYDDDETDLTVMRVVGEGRVRGAGRDRPRCRLTWDLFDLRDAVTGFTSMARTTAFPCTIVARLLASGRLRRPGVVPPELLAETPGIADAMLRGLARRGVRYASAVERLDPHRA
jgi:saccharopine dehydrogenase-like NADP-dependent oxidoreductase